MQEFLVLCPIIKKKSKQQKVDTIPTSTLDLFGKSYWDWRFHENYHYISPCFWEMLGYKSEEFAHKPDAWKSIITPEGLRQTLEQLDQHIRTQGKTPFETRVHYRHKTKASVCILTRGRVISWDKDGKPLRMIAAHEALTSQKELEQTLNDALSLQELIINETPDLIFIKDQDFKIVSANNSFKKLFPEDMQHQIIGYTTLERFKEYERNKFLECDREAFNKGYANYMIKVRLPNGTNRTMSTKKLRFETEDGTPLLLNISRDVTEHKQLVERNEELREFAQIASHDLKEPLRGINNYAKLLQLEHKDALDEDAQRCLNRISDLAKRMDELLGKLLEYTRISRDQQPFRVHNLNHILTNVEGMLDYTIKEQKVSIIRKNLLPSIACEEILIQEVFTNLILNSIKYNDSPRKRIEIGVVQEEGDTPVFYVRDNGIGIKQAHYKSIFQIFKRLNPNRSYGGGSGAGLTITKKIINQHGGDIWIDSTPGQGSTFYFTLAP